MPPSPMDYPSVITVENADGLILSVILPQELFFYRALPSVRPSVFDFFICNRISDGMENYRRLVSQWIDSVSETVNNNVTDRCHALHRQN
jgi:hypothetical protein